jgi:hypothetical protein
MARRVVGFGQTFSGEARDLDSEGIVAACGARQEGIRQSHGCNGCV